MLRCEPREVLLRTIDQARQPLLPPLLPESPRCPLSQLDRSRSRKPLLRSMSQRCELESNKRCWILRLMPLSCGATRKSSRKPCVLSQSQLRLPQKPESLRRWRQSGTCARTALQNLRLTSGSWQVLWKPWKSRVGLPRRRRQNPAIAERAFPDSLAQP